MLRLMIAFMFAVPSTLFYQSATSGATAQSRDDLRSYLSGNGLLNRGLYDLAAAEYRTFLSKHPNHDKAPTARYGLGVCMFRLERFEDAIKELSPLRSRRRFPFAAEVATMIGQCHLQRRQLDQAGEAFAEVVEKHADHDLADDAAAGWVEVLYRAKKYDEAIERSRDFVSRWSRSPLRERTEFFRGLSEMAMENYAEAAQRFDALLSRNPQSPFAEQATFLLAQCHHHNNALENAARAYRKVLEKTANQYLPEALHGLAMLLQQQGKPSEAGVLLDRLLTEHGDNSLSTSARLQRGRAWFDLGQIAKARGVFEQVANEDGDFKDDAAYWIAKCKIREGDHTGAASDLNRAMKAFPDSSLMAEMLYDRAVALVQSDRLEAAVNALGDFRGRYPSHDMAVEALHLLAVTEHKRERYDESQVFCAAFLKDFNDHELAMSVQFLSAENDFLSGRYESAARGYDRFLDRDPGGSDALRAKYRLGMTLYRLERFADAEEYLSEVAASSPGDSAFRLTALALGDINFQRGDWKQAERHLVEYLSSSLDAPSADDAMLKLGLALGRQARHEDALRSYDRLLDSFDDSPHRLQAIFERGQSLVALKRGNEARQAFEEVLKIGGASRFAPHAMNHLGAIAMADGRFDEAAVYFDGVVDNMDGPEGSAEAAFQRGQALMAAQQFEPAQQVFETFLQNAPSHDRVPQASAQLAISYARQNQYSKALEAIVEVEEAYGEKLDPTLKSSLAYEKAWCQRELGQSEEAMKTYRNLLLLPSTGSSKANATLDLAGLEADAGRHETAAKLLRELRSSMAAGQTAASAEVREQSTYRLAVSAFELEQYSECVTLCEEFITNFPGSTFLASAAYFGGEAAFRMNKHEQAVKMLSTVVKSFPNDPAFGPSLLRLGEAQAVMQRWSLSEKALTDYLTRFAESEHWFQAQFGLGWARENQSRYDEAIAAYRKVVERHQGPTAARAQFQIGESLFAKKEYEKAVAELIKVDILYAYPEWSAAALYEAGRCFEQLGKTVEARKQYKAVTERFKETRWAQLSSSRLTALPARPLSGGKDKKPPTTRSSLPGV